MSLVRALAAARIALRFGEVERATLHPDGRAETDTTHTIMLILVSADLARAEGLDVATTVQFAAVHDLPETYAGDTNTAGGLTDTQRAEKERREAVAVERIARELGEDSWAVQWLRRYERQDEPEARLVRFADKILPKLTHAINAGIALEKIGMGAGEAFSAHVAQGASLVADNPSLTATAELFDEAHRLAILEYVKRVARDLGPGEGYFLRQAARFGLIRQEDCP